ncbi:MAG: hypothetical protein H7A45_03185 [Verrucomicrobiales bacterium]|nr:hypothetical protein [Verrucomicrobiales bacterium]MCP5527803.1 hypothetical protein [Verrucomicrobiales bacterium]
MRFTATTIIALLSTALTLGTARAADGPAATKASAWVAPVANPIFFESPAIGTEARPIFIWQNLNQDFVTQGGDAQVYALQLRIALTERLAIIATKDGFVDFNPAAVLPHDEGWADIAAGVKYAVVSDDQARFVLTPGFTFKIPIGEESAFQGNGDGELDLFVSAAKAFGPVEVMGNFGVRLPMNMDEETSQLHYSLQVAYPVCRWFKPFAVCNAYTVLSEGDNLPLGSEGYDLINFGVSNAAGETMVVVGGGFRTELLKQLDLGFAYEKGVTHSDGIFDDRFTVDAVIHF